MTTRRYSGNGARALLVGAMSATLVACGGSSGDGDPLGGLGDSNGDGIEDVDFDGDGIADDVNGDGLEDFDLNNDGIKDVDINDNGIIDSEEGGDVGGGSELSCPGGGEDADSSDDQWNNNCVLQRDLSGARAYTSYYTRGVQRILYCLGYDEGADDIGSFADAQYGPTTERAVQAFQDDRGLVADGIVGPQTWQALRQSLVLLPETADNIQNRDDSYAIDGAVPDVACGDQVQFYQGYDEDNISDSWSLANNAGETQRVEFSIRSPFE